jgi:Family of unknown function (DUF6677)
LQTNDEITRPFNIQASISGLPRPYPRIIRIFAVIVAWLVPGAGHLLLRKFGRGILFLVVIAGAFALGLALHGRLFWPAVAEPPSSLHFDLITVLWFFAQIGSGLCYLGSYLLGIGVVPRWEAPTFEYGNAFMFLAGLLNYLVIHDAYDIAAGRKR